MINNMNDVPSLLRSETRNQNHWILIRLEGTNSNRSGIGARLTCSTGKFRQTDEVRSGGSFSSQNDFRVHFGIGNASRVDLLEVQWPGGGVDRIRDLRADQILLLKEGAGRY